MPDPTLRAGAAPSDRACRHCGSELAGRYCHACGEDSFPAETSWRSWTAQSSRVLRTLRSLWLEPGRLAIDHLHGARVGYVAPWTLFLNAVAVFFLFSSATQFQLTSMAEQNAPWMQPLVEQQAKARGVSPTALLERAERRFQSVYTLALALVSGVGYTLVYRLLYRRSLDGWRGAFTLALNYLAFLFTLFLPWLVVTTLARHAFGAVAMFASVMLGLVAAFAWNAAAARRIGRHGWPMAFAKGFAVVVAGFVIDTAMTMLAVAVTLRIA